MSTTTNYNLEKYDADRVPSEITLPEGFIIPGGEA